MLKENLCEVCGEGFMGSGYPIRLSAITSKASWHRSTTFEHGIICSKCAEELNEIIDKWMAKKGVKIKEYSGKIKNK